MKSGAWLALAAASLMIAAPSWAVDRDAIVIGALLARSGPQPEIVAEIARGFDLALDEVGRHIDGRAILVREVETRGDAATAVQLARELIAEHKADILFGPAGSSEALAVREVAHASGVPMIVPDAPLAALTGERCSPYVLRVSHAPDQTAAPLGAWLALKGKAKRAYLLAPDTALGRDMLGAFRRGFEASGGEVVGEEYLPPQKHEFEAYLLKLRLVGADSIYAFFAGEAARALVGAFEELKLEASVQLVGPGPLASPNGIAPRHGGHGVTTAITYAPGLDSAANRAFVEAYNARFGRLPSEHAAQGYDGGRLIVEALKQTRGRTDNRRALAAIMTRVTFEGPRGPMRIDPRTNNIVQDILIARTRKSGSQIAYDVIERLRAIAQPVNGCVM